MNCGRRAAIDFGAGGGVADGRRSGERKRTFPEVTVDMAGATSLSACAPFGDAVAGEPVDARVSESLLAGPAGFPGDMEAAPTGAGIEGFRHWTGPPSAGTARREIIRPFSKTT
jgi:hypothetical protein